MQAQKYSIKQLPLDDRPREKLLSKSPSALSNSELLAILIKHGTPERNVLDLAKDVLSLCNKDLALLGKLSVTDLMAIPGMGQAKAISIVAALELGRRRYGAIGLKTRIKDSKDVAGYLQSLLQDHVHEVFGVLFLNQGNRINHFSILSQGGITATVADPRVILKKALEVDAVSLILCHNHPSGNLKPSAADKELTAKVCQAARFFDIKVLDHLIVSEEGYYSFADAGML